ncbi:MAG: hypothetical protein VW500_05815, partial [Aquiluna sp.]
MQAASDSENFELAA